MKTRKIGSRLENSVTWFSILSAEWTKNLLQALAVRNLPQLSINMPGVTGDAASLNKRKRTSADRRPSKRARSESSEADGQAQILLLENEIFEAKKNYNNIAKLIKIFKDDKGDADNLVVAAISLCRVFVRLMASGDMVRRRGSTEKEVVVIKWLKERYTEYKSSLLVLLNEEGLESTALTLCMRLLKSEGEHLLSGQEYNFPGSFLSEIVQILVGPESSEAARAEFGGKYVEEYDDIRYYTFKALKSVSAPVSPLSHLTVTQGDSTRLSTPIG